MTDRPDTNQDLQMTLAQIEETLAHAANPAALVDGVSAQLGTLYTSAEASGDNNAMVAIEQTWNNVQMLAKSVAANREAYLTAKDIAETLRNQRDNIAREHGELIEAMNYCDTDHPAVADLVETVTEANNEEASIWFDESVEEAIYSQFQDVFNYDEDYRVHMEIFLDIFRNNIEVLPNRRREFYAWLKSVEADNADKGGDDDDE